MEKSGIEIGDAAAPFVLADQDGKIAHRWKRASAKGHEANVRERLEKLQGR